ncbi:MAG: hypothetical protein PHC83_08895 [Bacteroidales bacterium]|nr:hypothetical protein [Bacteroidales bacterium]
MKNILNLISFMIFALITMISCNKEKENKNVIPSYEHSVIQKFNPDDGYPFILTETEAPFQYAIYQEDEDSLFANIKSILEEETNFGYFALSFNDENNLLFYGFISETSSYYDTTWIIDQIDTNEGSGYTCFGWKIKDKKESEDFNETQEWAHEKMQQGYRVDINYNKRTKKYFAIALKWEE